MSVEGKIQKEAPKPQNNIGSYFGLTAIAPGVLAVMAYEFVMFIYHLAWPDSGNYNPLFGLGIMIPMIFLSEFFTFFMSRALAKKTEKLADAIRRVADGDYSVKLNKKGMAPYEELVDDFNKMTEELSSVETLRKNFIGDFAHEFKTPIASINGFANLLLDSGDSLSEEEKQEYLGIIASESKRLTNMARQNMLLSRLDTTVELKDLEDFSLDEQIKQDIILLSESWSAKDIDMQIELEEYTYHGNPELTSHIWINILNNAIKFTPDGGTIKVILRKLDSGRALVTIADTGIGMDEETCRHIFDRYYQADASHASKGLGLGLSIVQRVVELCRGSIRVDSRPGEGTSFIVEL